MKILLLIFLAICSNAFAKKPIKVLVIDTGISAIPPIRPYLPSFTYNSDYLDQLGHGTHIASVIIYGNLRDTKSQKVCKNVELYSCNYFNQNNKLAASNFCFKRALAEKFDIINYSNGGLQRDKTEEYLIKKLIKIGTKIIVSAGNKGVDLKKEAYYPASYKFEFNLNNLIVVGNKNKDGQFHNTSNYHKDIESEVGVDVMGYGPNGDFLTLTGTSQAAAIKTHKILLDMCKERGL